MIISQKIFALMKQRNMTQKYFSEQTEISQSTISDWKRKQTNPSADKILIESFRKLNIKQKQRVLGYMDALSKTE